VHDEVVESHNSEHLDDDDHSKDQFVDNFEAPESNSSKEEML
jgi:hypothetical protein